MKRIAAVALILSVTGLIACSDSSSPSGGDAPAGPSPENAAATEEPVAEPTPGCEDLPLGTESYSGRSKSPILQDAGGKVPAQANIFAAGRAAPPAPGGGGGGVLPPVFLLPGGTSRVLTFPSVTGRITHWLDTRDWNGPDGDGIGPIDVRSLQGIAGIVHRTNKSFLVGVFLTDAPPSGAAPPRLDFSESEFSGSGSQAVWVPKGERFGVLAPEIGQTFLVGNGKGRSYAVPDEATRLFLGFADARLWVGCPGWYGNNAGKVSADVHVAGK